MDDPDMPDRTPRLRTDRAALLLLLLFLAATTLATVRLQLHREAECWRETDDYADGRRPTPPSRHNCLR